MNTCVAHQFTVRTHTQATGLLLSSLGVKKHFNRSTSNNNLTVLMLQAALILHSCTEQSINQSMPLNYNVTSPSPTFPRTVNPMEQHMERKFPYGMRIIKKRSYY